MIGPHWAALLHRAPGSPQRAPLGTGASQMAIQSAVAPSARAGWALRSYRERNAVLDPHCGHTNISTVPASENPRTGTLMHPTRFVPLHPLLQSPRHDTPTKSLRVQKVLFSTNKLPAVMRRLLKPGTSRTGDRDLPNTQVRKVWLSGTWLLRGCRSIS